MRLNDEESDYAKTLHKLRHGIADRISGRQVQRLREEDRKDSGGKEGVECSESEWVRPQRNNRNMAL